MATTAVAGVAPSLEAALSDPSQILHRSDGTLAVWVQFTDRGADTRPTADHLSLRALERRGRALAPGTPLLSSRDLAPANAYLDAVLGSGARLRHQSRWLNAVSLEATEDQIRAIAAMPWVASVRPVAMSLRHPRSTDQTSAPRAEQHEPALNSGFSYGGSLPAAEQINLPPVHDLGLSGQGVVVGMLDSGFHLTHAALGHLQVLATWDFTHGDADVGYEEGQDAVPWQADHGTKTLSVLSAFMDGEIVGSAFGAAVVLAKTEDVSDEVPAEEDRWVAGLEWLEAQGCDIVTSSLGYYHWYSYDDLDGNTALCTIAADIAVGHGMVVFNCAGNQRQDTEFPHLIAPADADSVITVGAVDVWGNLADFSSPGPTADGRTKPDLVANGVSAHCIADWNDHSYQGASGTSYSTPLLAGVAALMLERLPGLTPMQIREALRETADNRLRPDDDLGWGVVDALAAVTYHGPSIVHSPLADTEDAAGPYTIAATITSRVPLNPSGLALTWRVAGGAWNTVPLQAAGGDLYTTDVPGQPLGTTVEYFLEAADADGISLTEPLAAPETAHSFRVISDTEAPTLTHVAQGPQTPTTWPPVLRAQAEDNLAVASVSMRYRIDGGAELGPFIMTYSEASQLYELSFPADDVIVGQTISYTIDATDASAAANTTSSGPHTVPIRSSLGAVLIIDNGPGGHPAQPTRSSSDAIATWLGEAGYALTEVHYTNVTEQDFLSTDAVVLACGSNGSGAGSASLRGLLIDWVRDGGRVLVEGGELGYAAMEYPGYPDLAAEVLHIDAFYGDWVYDYVASQVWPWHPLLHRPHGLAQELHLNAPGPYATNVADVVRGAEGTHVPYRTIYTPATGSVVTWDDNSAPEAGQTVFISLDVSYLDDAVGRQLLANAMSYLTAPEPPGGASISGTVLLAGGGELAGTVVSTRTATAVTDAEGEYTLSGLYGGQHRLSITRPGYAPQEITVDLLDDQLLAGIDATLQPVTEVHAAVQADLPIPDYDPAGVSSVIDITDAGTLLGLSVDIDISHNYIGNLEVSLTSPGGTTVTLHDHSGSSADDLVGNWPATLSVDGPGALSDFHGEDVAGSWILHVADTHYAVWGTLNSWGVNLLVADQMTAVDPRDMPHATRLVGNRPNPFNPQTTIAFELRAAGPVQLDIHDVRGRRVRRLIMTTMPAGRHEVRWDGCDHAGRAQSSGLYFCRLVADRKELMHKLTLVR